MKSVVVFLMALGLSCMQIFGQESIKKDTIKLGAGLKKDVGGKFLSINPDRKSTRLNSSHMSESRMPSSA